MNILAPKSNTSNDIYSLSEMIYMSGFLKKHGYTPSVAICTETDLLELTGERLKCDTILVVQSISLNALRWLKVCGTRFCARVLLYGLDAQVYREYIEREFSFAKVVPSFSYQYILNCLTKGTEHALATDAAEIDHPDYSVTQTTRMPIIPIISSRGCRNSCSFCAITCSNIFTSDYIARSAQSVFEEVYNYYTIYNKTRFCFVDSSFLIKESQSIDRALAFAHSIMKSEASIKFTIETRIDCANREVVLALKRAGLSRILFGVENLDRDVLCRYNKQITPEMILETIKDMQDIDMPMELYMILFDPDTSVEELMHNLDMIIDKELYRYINMDAAFRKLLLLPNNRVKLNGPICYTMDGNSQYPWLEKSSAYTINDGQMQLLFHSLIEYIDIWQADVHRTIIQISGVKNKSAYREQRKKRFFEGLQRVLRNIDYFDTSKKIQSILSEY